jgi:hypothetical protein
VLPLTRPEHMPLDRRDFDPRFLNPEPAADEGAARRASADSLREQAASCRRLASAARTRSGMTSLQELGDHFDEQAHKIDPSSQRR